MVCTFFAAGQFISPLAAPLAALSIFSIVVIFKNEFFGFLLLVAINALAMVVTRGDNFGAFYIASGSITAIILISFGLKIFLARSSQVIVTHSQTFFLLYFLWGTLLGLVGTLLWNNVISSTALESSVALPFIVLPILMYRLLELDSKREKVLWCVILVLWSILLISNVMHLRSNIANAIYLFETGRSTFDIFINSLILFVFISLSFTVRNKRMRFLLLGGSVLCLAGIAMCFFRTIWLTDLLMIPLIVLITKKDERKDGIRFLGILLLSLLVIMAVLYIRFPLISLLLKNYLARFQSSSQVATDVSLVNRYIEWRGVLKRIEFSPIIGLGFGGVYFDYAWVAGYSKFVSYTHNGFLYIILKTGIVGFVFVSTSFISIIIRGIRLCRNDKLSGISRALVRAGTVFLLSLLLINNTINVLTQRDAMLWAGIVFGFFLVCEKYLSKHSGNSTTFFESRGGNNLVA